MVPLLEEPRTEADTGVYRKGIESGVQQQISDYKTGLQEYSNKTFGMARGSDEKTLAVHA